MHICARLAYFNALLGASLFGTDLEKITVEETSQTHSLTGTDFFDKIGQINSASGGLEGVLKNIPGVLFSDKFRAPQDIKPPSFSINGARIYEDALSIDGVNLSNTNDPGSKNGIDSLDEHEQGLFLDNAEIASVKIYKSAVPARFGGFAGGVVDLRTKDPTKAFGLDVFYGKTSSRLTSFKVFQKPPDPSSPISRPAPPVTPVFERYRLGAKLNLALLDGASLAFVRQNSVQSLLFLQKARTQTQQNDNYLVKLKKGFGSWDLTGTLNYSPFTQSSFLQDVKDSAYKTQGGGFAAALRAKDGVQNFKFGFTRTQNARQAPNAYYEWKNSPQKSWGAAADLARSKEGGYGSLQSLCTKLSAEYENALDLERYKMGAFEFGAGAVLENASYERAQDLLFYAGAQDKLSELECREQDACASGDQFFNHRRVYPSAKTSVDLASFGAFGELSTALWRFDVAGGLRADYNSFLKNLDLSPRFRVSYDVFGSGGTVFELGLNRYYTGALLAYKLREARKPFVNESRELVGNVIGDWEKDLQSASYKYEFTNLKTPHTDELSLGVVQKIPLGSLSANAIWRRGKDEFSRTISPRRADGFKYFLMNNRGRSSYQGLSFAYRLDLERTFFMLGLNFSKAKTSAETYDEQIDETKEAGFVSYGGKRTRYEDLDALRSDYARSFVGNATLSQKLWGRAFLTLSARYLGKTPQIINTHEKDKNLKDENGDELNIYEKTYKPAVFIADLKLGVSAGALRLEAEVNNLFNARRYTVLKNQSGIEIGRSFWLLASVKI
ncbi:MAG: hypothetical protein ACTTIC_03880 [Helicobacteraceae bacterium]